MSKLVTYSILSEDSTMPELRSNIERTFPNTTKRQHVVGDVRVTKMVYTPFAANKILQVDASTQSVGGNNHQVAIQFLNVDFTNGDVEVTAATGQKINIQQIAVTATNVKVRCDCLDFRFRFADWNFADNSLVGNPPPPYIRITTTRPPANPLETPGMCKHVIKVFDELRRQGIIQ